VGGTGTDPKVEVILHYLRERRWLERNGAIIFSQYKTTAEWVLEALCAAFPDEPVALYAGGAASFVQRGTDRRSATREQIKKSIQEGDIRLVCATDAACEGLNLQRLGAQVNVTCRGTHRGSYSAWGGCKVQEALPGHVRGLQESDGLQGSAAGGTLPLSRPVRCPSHQLPDQGSLVTLSMPIDGASRDY
jgi:hypothetical protein